MADSVAQAYPFSRIRLEQLRAAPVLADQVLGQECEDALVPDPDVTGLEDPVVLVDARPRLLNGTTTDLLIQPPDAEDLRVSPLR